MATQSSSEPTEGQTTEPVEVESTADTAAVSADDEPTAEKSSPASEPAVESTVVFVQAPQPPKKRGARGVGALVVVFSTLLFAAVYAALVFVVALFGSLSGLIQAVQFMSSVNFYVPVIVFFFAHLLLVVIVNRGGWWAHVLGGFVVAFVVWVGFVGAALISAGAVGAASGVVGAVVLQQLTNPLGFAAAIAAREVPIWVGGMVSKRGRSARARNVEAQAAYERDMAEHRATISNAPSTTTRTAV